MHLKYFVNFYFLNIVLGSFTSTPPSSVTKCTGGDIQLTWAYVPPTGKSAILVNWKKDGDAILLWNVGPNTLIYGTGYNASMLSHDNTNGQITLVNSDESSTGIYTCEATYSSPVELAQSNQTDLKVFDTITTSMNCECGINGIQCDLPSPITEVTINDTLQSLPYLPQNVSSYMVCMAGDAAVCLANNIDSCEQIDLCPKGPEITTEEHQSTPEQSTFGSSIISTVLPHSATPGSGPEITTEKHQSTPEQSTFGSSIIYTVFPYSATLGSGKDLTDPVHTTTTSTDDQVSTNSTAVTEQNRLLIPLVISISAVSFCLLVIFVMTISVVYYKRHSNGQKTSDDNLDLSQPSKEPRVYKKKTKSVSQWKDENENASSVPYPSRNISETSDQYSHSLRDVQYQHSRNNNYRAYYGEDRRVQAFETYLPHAYYRQPRQVNIRDDYIVYYGHKKRGVMNSQDPYHSYPNNSFYWE